MKLNVLTTYTVNNGADQTKDMIIEMPDAFADTPVERYALMIKAADQLIAKGQIMVSGVKILTEKELAA